MARIKLELNLVREAESLLKASIGMHPANSNAQCLLSDVYLRSGQSNMALETLETALSFDFTLRNLPSFKALKARALKEQGHYDECVSLLESILSLPEFKALLLSNIIALRRLKASIND